MKCDTPMTLEEAKARFGIVDRQPIPMTNEEYLRSCTTEQLAEWLGDKLDYCQIMWYWACDKCTWSKKHESCMNDKEKWMEWLKQPHKDGES